jgi:hypothetical protein
MKATALITLASGAWVALGRAWNYRRRAARFLRSIVLRRPAGRHAGGSR